MKCWHLTHTSDGRYPLFPDEETRRSAVRKLARVAGAELVLFCIVDDHVHSVVRADRARAGRLAQAILRSLRSIAAATIHSTHIRSVEDRSHLEWLVKYLLTQPKRHEMATHLALWSGSCFQDLARARIVEGMRLQLCNVLPRFRIRTAYEAVGLPPREIAPAQDPAVRAAGAARLVSAAGAALAVNPSLSGNTDPIVRARRAVVQVAHKVDISFAEVAWALGITRRSAMRLVESPAEDDVQQAIRRRLAIEDVVYRRTFG